MEKIPREIEKRYLIVGLGNPGREYRSNRHNIGFMVVDRLSESNDLKLSRKQFKAKVGTGYLQDQPVILAKPQTYMNMSGEAVARLVHFYRIDISQSLVIYDEIDLPLGTLRLREKGGSGGHNGMKSIIKHIGTDFPRMRLGIGRPPGRMDPAAYVLRDFNTDQMPIVNELIDMAVSAVEFFMTEGIDLAMTRFNGEVSLPE